MLLQKILHLEIILPPSCLIMVKHLEMIPKTNIVKFPLFNDVNSRHFYNMSDCILGQVIVHFKSDVTFALKIS